MTTKNKLLIVIPSIVLISLILTLTPFSMAQNLSKGGPCFHSRQTCLGSSLFNSLVPQDQPTVAVQESTWFDQEPMLAEVAIARDMDPSRHNLFQDSVSLRC